MKREKVLWQLAGLVSTIVLGTILHFLYEWTLLAVFAPFSAVNESTWEHMKIFFFPTFLFAIVQGFFFVKYYPNYWWIKLLGILLGTLLIPTLFYTYNGAFGKSPDWLNILFFFLSAFAAYFVEFLLLKEGEVKNDSQIFPVILLSLIASAFIICTVYPPKLPLFQDPIGKFYGLKK